MRNIRAGAGLNQARPSHHPAGRVRVAPGFAARSLGFLRRSRQRWNITKEGPFETEELEATRRQIEQSIQRCAIAKGRRQRIEGSIWNRLWITYFDDEPQRGFNSALGSNAVACDHNWSTPELEE